MFGGVLRLILEGPEFHLWPWLKINHVHWRHRLAGTKQGLKHIRVNSTYCLWISTSATAGACRRASSGTCSETTRTTAWAVTRTTTRIWRGSAGWTASYGTNFGTPLRGGAAGCRGGRPSAGTCHPGTDGPVNRPESRCPATWTATGRPRTGNRCAPVWWRTTRPTSRTSCRENTRKCVCSGSICICCNRFSRRAS